MGDNKNIIEQVWNKGQKVDGYNADQYRKDECGAWIEYSKYGNRDSSYGWEVDHITPGGSDLLSNLRPLQWKNNVEKSDGRLKCNIISDKNSNISK